MLTLQELKQVVSNREERRKVPSAKYLRENEVAVARRTGQKAMQQVMESEGERTKK